MTTENNIPDFNPQSTLDKLVQWTEAKSQQKNNGWVVSVIVSVVVFFILAILSFSAWKSGKKIAELKHKIDVDEEKRIQSVLDTKLAEKEDLKQKLDNEIEIIKVRIEDNKKLINELESTRIKDKEQIDKIQSWDQI